MWLNCRLYERADIARRKGRLHAVFLTGDYVYSSIIPNFISFDLKLIKIPLRKFIHQNLKLVTIFSFHPKCKRIVVLLLDRFNRTNIINFFYVQLGIHNISIVLPVKNSITTSRFFFLSQRNKAAFYSTSPYNINWLF